MANTTFSKEEKAAMRAVATEVKVAKAGADMEAACLAAITEMSGTDQELAQTCTISSRKTPPWVPRPGTACRRT
ncbi:hypothetical protein ACIPVK_03680 [Paeniglutamicibacter sp. MACA_103]|uniref:hypothetical protein n=1 Tax=Paeniglutamicibacter sp. MACA_103 TaxID=3377337 RepID=UPI0038952B89